MISPGAHFAGREVVAHDRARVSACLAARLGEQINAGLGLTAEASIGEVVAVSKK